VACPLCRTKFTVPAKGVDDLPKNFFIQKLIDVMTTRTNEDGSKQIVVKCRKHPHKAVELFCFDCQSTMCVECLDESHKSHKYSVVSKVVDEFRKQMTVDIKRMVEAKATCRGMLNLQEQKKKDFYSEVDRIEKEICDQAEQLKKVIESAKCELLQDIEEKKKKRITQIQHVIEDVEQQMSFIDSCIQYTEELRDKGTAEDVAQQRNALHNRANELTKLNNIHREINESGPLEAKFEAAKIPANVVNSLIGQINWQLVGGK
jgi:B-box zinc finger